MFKFLKPGGTSGEPKPVKRGPGFFHKKSEEWVAVDFASDSIKILRAKSSAGSWTIEEALSKKIDRRIEGGIQKFLAGYFAGLSQPPQQIICPVSSKNVLSKNVEIPSTEREEITKIIDFQAGRFTPYSRDEIVLDFICMETAKQHYTSVLLFIVSRKLVDRYWRLFEEIGVPIKIVIASEALGMTYAEMVEQDTGAVAGIHLGEDAADFTVMDHRQMVFVRNLPVGAEHFAGHWETAGVEFANELNKSWVAYQDEGEGRPIKHLVVTGIVKDPDGFKKVLQSSCPFLQEAQTALKFLDYRSHFKTTEAAFNEMNAQAETSFFELAASITQSSKLKVDLLPREIKLKRRFQDVSHDITALGISLMSIFLVISLYLGTKYYIKKLRLENLEQKHQVAFEKARDLERISTKNQVVRRILQGRGKGLYVYEIMNRLIGPDIYLSRFTYEDGGKLALTGTAESMSRVFAFVTKMEESNYFTTVATKETKSRTEAGKDVADFQIESVFTESI